MNNVGAFLLIFLFPFMLWGQSHKWEVGILAGGTRFGGDIVQPSFFNTGEFNLAFSVFMRYNLNSNLALRASFSQALLTGDDAQVDFPVWRRERSISFTTPIREYALLLEWDILGHRRGWSSNRPTTVSPYLFIGIGNTNYDPKANFEENQLDGLEEEIQLDRENGQEFSRFTLPLGLGVKYDMSSDLTLGLEIGWRTSFTDYMDGVSEVGDPDDNDWYIIGGFSMAYRFSNLGSGNKACPHF